MRLCRNGPLTAISRRKFGRVKIRKPEKPNKEVERDHAAELVTIEELSRYLHVPERILYRRIRTGQLPGRKVGGRWQLELLRVQDWLVDTYELKTSAEKKRSK